MNPRLGLVAVPTWFWVQPDTYRGQELSASDNLVVTHEDCQLVPQLDPVTGELSGTQKHCATTADTYRVQVSLVDPTFQWDFGDGSRRPGSLGQPYPQPSDVRHAYANSSLQTATGYPIALTVTWAATYSVTGPVNISGTLAPTTRTYGPFPHPVREAQAVLTGP
jgi:hypothetical protein